MVKIEEGKFYKTRDGRKVGPAKRIPDVKDWPWDVGDSNLRRDNGMAGGYGAYGPEYDLISEWPDEETGPIRTITRREIVPGQWGNINVNCVVDGNVFINVRDDFGHVAFNAEQLREAAHLFNQLAEFLEGEVE